MSNSFEIGPVQVGAGRLFLIAGPCVIESEAHVRTMADALQRIASDLDIPFIFKASYDKANRTSVKSFRGPGLLEGTRILARLARETGLPVLTDVHEPAHCEVAAEAVDVLQIPAFLCRQTDLLLAAAKTGRAINVKKGQFVAPWDMTHTVEKVRSAGNERIFLTERGSSFGYNNLVVDFRSLPVMRALAPVVFDGAHSVQQPSAANGVSGGQPEFIPLLVRAAVAAGIDGLFDDAFGPVADDIYGVIDAGTLAGLELRSGRGGDLLLRLFRGGLYVLLIGRSRVCLFNDCCRIIDRFSC